MFSIEPLEPRALLTTLLPGFIESTVATGLAEPSAMAFAPDGRLFVTEQTGALRVVKNNALLATPFVTLKVDSRGERGLLGVAFDPNFASNHFVYVYYTVPGRKGAPVHNRVSRFTAAGDTAAKHSEKILLDLDNLTSASNHNGGALAFGPDGKLYVAVGENNNGANAATLSNRLGKILRINPDGTIPADNPFFTQTTGPNRAIWAMGLRNPFNIAFDPATGRLHINDVGEHTWEEINQGVAGSNYGWPATEGPTARPRYRAPVFAYRHGDSTTTGHAIVGAAFYSPTTRTFGKSYAGDYFFADLSTGWIRRLDTATRRAALFATGISVPVTLAVNDDGSLWYLARGEGDTTGVLRRVQHVSTLATPPAATNPISPFSKKLLTLEDWLHGAPVAPISR
jgi:glucose/arabinose dehydrogenase